MFLLLFAAPAPAATSDELRAFLAFVPATQAAARRLSVDYFDLGVLAAITGKRGLQALSPLARRANIPSFGPMLARADAWKSKVGFTFEEIDSLGSTGIPPDTVRYYRLTPAVRSHVLTGAWNMRGFREFAAERVWGRGEPYKIDVEKIDPDDPFGGDLGRSSFVLLALPFLAESIAPAPLTLAIEAQARGGLAARPDVSALLTALDRGGGRLLQAMLLPEAADSMTASREPMAYSALLFADVEFSDRAEAQLLLVFDDCAKARAVEGPIAQEWDSQHPAIRAQRPSWSLIEGTPCVLAGRVAAPGVASERQFANPAYRLFVDAWLRRDLTALVRRAPR